MHKELAFGNGQRKMIVVGGGDDNTIYLNGAIVPRVKRFSHNTLRAFTLIDSKQGQLEKITQTWVSVSLTQDTTTIEEEQILFTNNNIPTTSSI